MSVKTVIVYPVENSKRCCNLINNNFIKLNQYDNIDFIFLHFDGENSLWKQYDWYNNSERIILKSLERGSKTFQWKLLKPNIVNDYDYIWLSDCDLGLELFEWKKFINIVIAQKSLITLPAIKGLNGGRSTDIPCLRYKAKHKRGYEYVGRSEVGTPFINTKCWNLIYEKLLLMNNRSDWGLCVFWSKLQSNKNLLVHCSPVVHYNFRNYGKNGAVRHYIHIPKIPSQKKRIQDFINIHK